MAAPASSKPGWVHYTCAFFGVTTLICGVGWYLANSSFTELQATSIANEKKATDASTLQRKLEADLTALKKKIGREFEAIGVEGEQNATTVLGAMQADIALAGNLAQQTYAATLLKLVEQANTLQKNLESADADKASLTARIAALEAEYNSMVVAEKGAKDKVEATLAANTSEAAEERAKKDKEIDEQRAALKTSQDDYAKMEDEYKKYVEKAEKREKNLTQAIQRLKDEMKSLQKFSFEQPLGKIVSVDTDSNVVTINLGSTDRLGKRTTFSVYTKANSGVARGAEDIKGGIEVINVIGGHLAQARITQEIIPSDPIAPGDPIYTPAWSPGRVEKFAFVGKFDFDGDGKHDEQQLQELVETNGALIGAAVDQKGVRNARKIDHDTKFLVVGEIPDPTELSDPEERRAVEEVKKHHEEMKKEADETGVTIVRKNDFLSWMGYRPQHKLYRLGDGRANNLPGSRTNNKSYSSGKKTGSLGKAYEEK